MADRRADFLKHLQIRVIRRKRMKRQRLLKLRQVQRILPVHLRSQLLKGRVQRRRSKTPKPPSE